MELEDYTLHSRKPKYEDELPPTYGRRRAESLSELDLEQELLNAYNDAQDMRDNIDTDVPFNQQAQVMNTITAILQKIVDMRKELQNMEKLKKQELALIAALKEFPELQETFLANYERIHKVM